MDTLREKHDRQRALTNKLDEIGWWRDMCNLGGYLWGGVTLVMVVSDLTIGKILGGDWQLGANWANVSPMLIMASILLFISARLTIYILKKQIELIREDCNGHT